MTPYGCFPRVHFTATTSSGRFGTHKELLGVCRLCVRGVMAGTCQMVEERTEYETPPRSIYLGGASWSCATYSKIIMIIMIVY